MNNFNNGSSSESRLNGDSSTESRLNGGVSDFDSSAATATVTEQTAPDNQGSFSATMSSAQQKHENIISGTVGALLFSLAGGIIYFLIYQFGFIAGIAGLITVAVSMFGYQLFSGVKNSKKGVIISVIISALMILLAEYMCLAYEIYDVFKDDYLITFFDAARSVPDFLKESDIMTSVITDVIIAYLLGGVAAFGIIRSALSSKKHKSAPVSDQQQEL